MKPRLQEIFALASTLGVLVGVPVGINSYQKSRVPHATRVIELTGVMKDGAWTDEKVTAATYGHRTYRPATVVVHAGEKVLLRLASADVTHGFYVPELGVGPVQVEPGHVVEVLLKADRAGEFTYYCTAVCGKCHHFMRGLIRVLGNEADTPASAIDTSTCPHHAPQPALRSLAERGAYLFQAKGCVKCHGDGGRGGIQNPNYLKDTVPALNILAELMMLFQKEDAELVVALLEKRVDPATQAGRQPFPRYEGFLAQYNAIRNLIRDGIPAAKKDPNGPVPPLSMPAWGDQLSAEDTDALIAYLIGQFPWEE